MGYLLRRLAIIQNMSHYFYSDVTSQSQPSKASRTESCTRSWEAAGHIWSSIILRRSKTTLKCISTRAFYVERYSVVFHTYGTDWDAGSLAQIAPTICLSHLVLDISFNNFYRFICLWVREPCTCNQNYYALSEILSYEINLLQL